MSKVQIKMFPDYCSSGLWRPDGCNIDAQDLGVSEALQLALEYWHEVWEWGIAPSFNEERKASQWYIKRWHEDGRKIAQLMSAENDAYEFVYCGGAEDERSEQQE